MTYFTIQEIAQANNGDTRFSYHNNQICVLPLSCDFSHLDAMFHMCCWFVEWDLHDQCVCVTVTEFARKTGDLHSLSTADIHVAALVYTLEKELVGSEHIRTEPANKVIVYVHSQTGCSQPNNLVRIIDMMFLVLSTCAWHPENCKCRLAIEYMSFRALALVCWVRRRLMIISTTDSDKVAKCKQIVFTCAVTNVCL